MITAGAGAGSVSGMLGEQAGFSRRPLQVGQQLAPPAVVQVVDPAGGFLE